jgi:hypothetical protein
MPSMSRPRAGAATRATSMTNTKCPPWLNTCAMPRTSSPRPSAGTVRSSLLVVPKTSVTESTTKPTARRSSSTMIHFVRRVRSPLGRPKRSRRSMTGTTSPRWSVTPSTTAGACGSSTKGMGLMISRTSKMDTAY